MLITVWKWEKSRNDPARPRPLKRLIASTLLALAVLGVSPACRPAVVRVPVSPEDIRRSNSAALEADIAFARRDYYAALIKFLEAGRLNPNSEYVFNKLGITYSRLHFYPQAIESFERAIALNPKYPYSYNNLGSVYFADNEKKKAERYFRRAIGIKKDEASFHINLGTLLFENKKYEKGREEWLIGLSLDPNILKNSEGAGLVAASSNINSAEKSYETARFYAAIEDVDKAVENLQQALSNGFTNLQALQTERDFDKIRKHEKFIAFMKYAIQLLKG
jgi:tetratricopeptide (TPR) repeat protein